MALVELKGGPEAKKWINRLAGREYKQAYNQFLDDCERLEKGDFTVDIEEFEKVSRHLFHNQYSGLATVRWDYLSGLRNKAVSKHFMHSTDKWIELYNTGKDNEIGNMRKIDFVESSLKLGGDCMIKLPKGYGEKKMAELAEARNRFSRLKTFDIKNRIDKFAKIYGRSFNSKDLLKQDEGLIRYLEDANHSMAVNPDFAETFSRSIANVLGEMLNNRVNYLEEGSKDYETILRSSDLVYNIARQFLEEKSIIGDYYLETLEPAKKAFDESARKGLMALEKNNRLEVLRARHYFSGRYAE